MTATSDQPAPSPETSRRRGATEINRRRGAPRGNRNALKSGRYTTKAKAERRRTRLLLRQLRAGLAYARSVIRARAAAAGLACLPPGPNPRKKFSKIEKQFLPERLAPKKFSKIEKQFSPDGYHILESPLLWEREGPIVLYAHAKHACDGMVRVLRPAKFLLHGVPSSFPRPSAEGPCLLPKEKTGNQSKNRNVSAFR